MIFPFISDGEFAMSEFGDLEDLMFGMMYCVAVVVVDGLLVGMWWPCSG